MSPEAQLIAIGEACGWRCVSNFKDAFACWVRPGLMDHQTEWLPNYLDDLNAMHEAEKVLTQWEEMVSYHSWLGYCGENNTSELHNCIHATAAQRAEAFLRTIGKWENTSAKEGQL